MTKRTLDDFVDKHLGKRIFILGTGPTLEELSEKDILQLEENEISITVNFSHLKVQNPTYWVSGGHPGQVAFMMEHLREETVPFFHQGPRERRHFPDVERIVHTHDQTVGPRKNPLTRIPVDNTLIGGHNILLAASHLAFIMGASEIVYIGFEQINRLHFYNLWDEEAQSDFKLKLKALAEKYHDNPQIVGCVAETLNVDEPDEQRWCHFKPREVCENLTFKKEGKEHHNYALFRNYVEQFQGAGIKTYTTATEGIAVDAGCEVVTLEYLFS
jgi:hypothetical protein